MRTRVVPASELDPKKGLRARDYVGPRISVGRLCKPKARAWKDYCLRNAQLKKDGTAVPRSAQPVVSVGDEGECYAGWAALAWPQVWWKESELEVVE